MSFHYLLRSKVGCTSLSILVTTFVEFVTLFNGYQDALELLVELVDSSSSTSIVGAQTWIRVSLI